MFCFVKPFIHATGFSQWLMTKFLSAEFIWRWEGEPSGEPIWVQGAGCGCWAPNFFGSAGALPFRKTSRQSPFAAVLGSTGASPSRFVHRLKSVSMKRSLLKQA